MSNVKFPEVEIINNKDGGLIYLFIDGKDIPTVQSVNIDFDKPQTCAVVTLKFLANINSTVDKEYPNAYSK